MRRITASVVCCPPRIAARQAGRSATMALDTYGHVFDELDGAERISAEQAIRKARAEARATLVRTAPNRVAPKKDETRQVAGFRKSPLTDSNCRPFLDYPQAEGI